MGDHLGEFRFDQNEQPDAPECLEAYLLVVLVIQVLQGGFDLRCPLPLTDGALLCIEEQN